MARIENHKQREAGSIGPRAEILPSKDTDQ